MTNKISWIHRNFENAPLAKLLRWSFPIIIIAASCLSLHFSKNEVFDKSDAFNILIILASAFDLGFSYLDKIYDGKNKNTEQKQNDIAMRNFIALLVLLTFIPIVVVIFAAL